MAKVHSVIVRHKVTPQGTAYAVAPPLLQPCCGPVQLGSAQRNLEKQQGMKMRVPAMKTVRHFESANVIFDPILLAEAFPGSTSDQALKGSGDTLSCRT